MSLTSDQMELREEAIRAHYAAAAALLEGFDHTPRLGKPVAEAPAPERSPGIARGRRFRSTTPGLVARSTARAEGVQLAQRIERADGDDPLISPLQATVLHVLRRAIAIAEAIGEEYAARTGLDAMKRGNLEGSLLANDREEFSELRSAEALVVLHVFGNATAFLLAPHQGEAVVELGSLDEFLTDNAQLALHGALWQLDQDIAKHASDEPRLVATIAAFAETLMEKAAARAATAPRLEPFNGASWRIEADDLPLNGFTPARKGKGQTLTMQFKKPNEVVGNHIAKYQAMRLAKMLMAYDFDRRLNPFAELGGFIFTFMGDDKPGTGKPR